MNGQRRSHNLPAEVTALVDRDRELAAATSTLLDPHVRLVTLTGAPGTGKTRVALALADKVRPAFADGVWLVPLAALQRADLVLPTIAQVLGVRALGRRPLAEALIHALAEQRSLLVLDNFEHVLPAARMLPALLEACPGLKILATSRARLRVTGEHQLPIPGLELPAIEPLPAPAVLVQVPAVRLFVERARAVRPDFHLSAGNARAVAELCVRLDGLPLAIELAAARCALLEPHELLARVERRLSLLTDGPADRPARHRTLRGAIGWSYDLLSPDQQGLFRTLGVFAGGCTLEAAQAIAGAPAGSGPDVLTGIEALLDRSLLRRVNQPDGGVRVDTLETLRDYASEQLAASGELEVTRQRHAEYFLAAAENVANPRLDGPEGPALMDRVERDHDNLRAALRWFVERRDAEASTRLAGALWSFWEKRGYWTEGIRWQETALGLGGGVSPAARARALIGLAVLYRERSEYAAAARFARESVDVQREMSDQNRLDGSRIMYSDIAALAGDPRRGAALAAETAAAAQRRGSLLGYAWSLLVQGNIAAYQADFVGAREYYELGLNVRAGQAGNEVDANLLLGLGVIRAGADDAATARPLLEDALALFRSRDEPRGVARVLLSLGALLARDGDGFAGRATLEESLTLFRKLGEAVGMALCALMLGLPLPEGMLAEVGEHALAMWWQVSTGRKAPPPGDLAAWRIMPERSAAPRSQSSDPSRLTRRELEVLALIGRHYSNRQIADELVLSVRTVERHITNIYAKTGLSSRRLAETYAAPRGLLPSD